MEFVSEIISGYCERHSDEESPLLKELNRETHLKAMIPRMLSGHLQGRFLSFISKIHKPAFILEIGTFTGYSALCLAEGLKENGKLISIDSNEETNAIAKKYFSKSEFKNRIELMEGKAAELIPHIQNEIDLAFIDADKSNYALYYEMVLPKMRKNGLIITDNTLWSGKVTGTEESMDKDTNSIHQFNNKIKNDNSVSVLQLPLRDGITLIYKR